LTRNRKEWNSLVEKTKPTAGCIIIVIIIITTTTTIIIIIIITITTTTTNLLTAIGLSLGGSSPTLVQTKIKIHKTTITRRRRRRRKK
jgi:hypothetical protein